MPSTPFQVFSLNNKNLYEWSGTKQPRQLLEAQSRYCGFRPHLHWVSLVQVRLRTEVLRTPRSTRPGFKLMTSRSWQYISCHWDSCSNHLAFSDLSRHELLNWNHWWILIELISFIGKLKNYWWKCMVTVVTTYPRISCSCLNSKLCSEL